MSGRVASMWLFGPALLWGAAAIAGLCATIVDDTAWSTIDRTASVVVRSETCAGCHPVEHRSWRASYHRTMTQRAEGAAILAPFAGESLEYLGFRATMTRSERGAPHVRITRSDAAPALLDVDVVMTVGSHRYQQFLARIDRGGGPEDVWRLPVAWHLGEERWIHLNAAFLEPEGARGEEADYMRHFSRWNDNCVLCHNTAPRPGLGEDGRFNTEVGELGIACEACHGPASAHAERHSNPLRRLLAGVADAGASGDGSIAAPSRLSPALESAICGRCHGNRIAKDVGAVLREGDGFLPGTDLGASSRPIFAWSTLGDPPQAPFGERFWPDGTPRLSAYEYQGLLLSPCYADGAVGGLGCGECHTMHGEEPSMQVRQDRRGDAACRACHDDAAVPQGHGGHRGITCMDCHMPRTTYGLVDGMISHRITSPDPAAWIGRDDQPDACTLCHVDRSRVWAARSLRALKLSGSAIAAERAAEEESWASRALLDLYAGDPIQRALAAHAIAREAAPVSPSLRLSWLVDALEDEYPAIRIFALRGLRTLSERAGRDDLRGLLAAYDFLGEVDMRVAAVDAIRRAIGPGPLAAHPERVERLIAAQERQIVWIGE
ncbi:MAG: ammonia-forming cytochrome c nitrite reductase subunit c552 [Nannocystis sp.]|nr:ammonia-forming cytochrome c nitrite reductase subunit c552 [Nannocystis sp.]